MTRLERAMRTGDHGTHEQAMTFALDLIEPYEAGDFLRMWREGAAEEYPEYYVWLERQETPQIERCPEPRQESDEYVCGRCSLRWDTHEDKPSCRRMI